MRDDNQDPRPGAAGPTRPEEQPGVGPADEAAIEQEIRRRRAFDLASAVARAGAGNLRGASPVPADRQLVLEAGALLAAHLADGEGSLTRVLLAQLADDPRLLATQRGHPAAALAALVDRTLASPAALADFVREVDARWGRDFDERPRFESPGRPPAADDPYTLAGVTERLTRLRQALREAT